MGAFVLPKCKEQSDECGGALFVCMKIGIVGLPNVGKSTLFKILTQKQVVIANYPFATIDPNIGVVEIPDERLKKLADFSGSRKIVPAIIEFTDIAGLVKGSAQGLGLGNEFLAHIRDVDAVLHLVRVFEDESIIHVEERPDPERDFEIINMELVFKDLNIASKALEKAGSESKSGDKTKTKRRNILQKIKSLLEENKLLFGLLDPDETRITSEIGLLTYKPMLAVFNISEKQLSQNWQPSDKLKKMLGSIAYLAIPVGVEEIVAQIASNATNATELEKREILDMAEVKETGLNTLIKKSCETLNLMTFFTTGEDETRAWTIPKDSQAPRAGRAIHSDFEEKFIRAEVIHWDKLLAAGSRAKARELGWLRTEGKDYVVKDGDVIEFKI